MDSASVSIDTGTYEELKGLASQLGRTVGETVALAVRGLRQDRISQQLNQPLEQHELSWLDAELG